MSAPLRIYPASQEVTKSAFAPKAGESATADQRAKHSTAGSGGVSDYMERLVKLIPAEVVGLYLVGIGVVPTNARSALVIWAVICFGLVILVRARATEDPANKLPPQWKAVAISSISFVVWAYNMLGAFVAYDLVIPYAGSLAVLLWTFLVPYIYHGE